MNLLEETIIAINKSGHKPSDIIFIGSEESGYSCTWDEFKALANRKYDQSYGAQKVASDLIIVFSDKQKMWRNEYDGAEWWELSVPFKQPKQKKKIKHLFVDEINEVGWVTLEELHKKGEGGKNEI